MTEALQKVTREMKAMSADKYDVTAQGEVQNLNISIRQTHKKCEKFDGQSSLLNWLITS